MGFLMAFSYMQTMYFDSNDPASAPPYLPHGSFVCKQSSAMSLSFTKDLYFICERKCDGYLPV